MSAAPKKGFWRAVQGEIRGVQSFLLLISLAAPPPGHCAHPGSCTVRAAAAACCRSQTAPPLFGGAQT